MKTTSCIFLRGIAVMAAAAMSLNASAATKATTKSINTNPPASRIELPAHMPAKCVSEAASRYNIPELAMLSIIKQESGGRLGVVASNKNGSKDYGPAQFNNRSWGKYMGEHYGISLDSLTNNMCQALMAQAYALRYEWNRCIKKGEASIWCAIAHYHSPTKKYQDIYVRNVWKRYQSIVTRGKF